MDCSMPGFPVHHQLPELAQIHVHQVGHGILDCKLWWYQLLQQINPRLCGLCTGTVFLMNAITRGSIPSGGRPSTWSSGTLILSTSRFYSPWGLWSPLHLAAEWPKNVDQARKRHFSTLSVFHLLNAQVSWSLLTAREAGKYRLALCPGGEETTGPSLSAIPGLCPKQPWGLGLNFCCSS